MRSVSKLDQRVAHHDILLHGDVYEGEGSSVDEDVTYSQITTLDEITQPDLPGRRSR